uniref:Histone-lysine N-methyltransferase NSD-like PHD zinc finger domain-containing protein n=1 Tax=Setaria italica TaxID=4555 RepID=K3ZF91_SETIT
MAPVDTSRSDPRRPERGGGIDQKRSKPKPRYDGDDFCAICDNGGDVTCCDGGCQRSFHLTDENKIPLPACSHLNIFKSLPFCLTCQVFQCEVDDCGRFYHPKCVAKLLYPESKLEASFFAVQVAAREKFTCPIHECIVCKGVENKNHRNMQFAVCRRCPTTYHRKCLPSSYIFSSNIPFETKKGPNGYMQRAWDEKHEIIKKLGTPKRNHIIFPDVKKLRVPKRLVDPPNEKGIPEEEVLKNASPEPSQSPPAVASDRNQCSCSGPFDSFAPESLFRHPYPGTC